MEINISDREAQKLIQAHQSKMNKRRVPKVPEQIKQIGIDNQVWIYNVSPFRLDRDLGSSGIFVIPACEKGQEYARAKAIDGSWSEVYVGMNPDSMDRFYEDKGGRYVAQQIIGRGHSMPPDLALDLQGVFIGSEVGPKAKPTKDELIAAKASLRSFYERKVNEARVWFNEGGNSPKYINNINRLAARELGLEDEVWLQERAAKGKQTCELCGHKSDVGVIKCPNCKEYIFDMERYEKLIKGGQLKK